MTKLDWENITNYIDSVGTTDTVFPFVKVQSSVKVTASGARDNIIYTIGGQSGTLLPGQSVTVTGTISSMTLRSASGRQPFQVWAVEAGTEKDETDTSYQGQIDGLTTALAQIGQQKADTTYVNQQLSNIGNASPKGTYATLSALQTAFPTGTTGIYLVTADNKWYYWNSSAWTAGGVYQPSITKGSITKDQLADFTFVTSDNLINPALLSNDGSWISPGDGTLQTAAIAGVRTTPPIRIKPNKTYYAIKYNVSDQKQVSNGFARYYALYDINGAYIKGSTYPNPITTPSNAYTIRLTFDLNDTLTGNPLYQAYLGEVNYPSTYIPYTEETNNIDGIYSNITSVQKNQTNQATINDTLKYDAYPFQPLATFGSDSVKAEIKKAIKKIEVYGANKTKKYCLGFLMRHATTYGTRIYLYECNADGSIGTRVGLTSITNYVEPSGIDEFLVAEDNSSKITAKVWIDWSQITDGANYDLTSYDKSGIDFRTYINTNTDGFDIKLPPTIPALVGHEINIYFENIVVCGDINNYNFYVSCSVGTTQNERWTYVPTAAGTYSLTIDVYKDFNFVATATTSIVIKDTSVGNGISKKGLFIGDSTTEAGTFTQELLNLFNADVMDITLLGTRGTAPNLHEGRGGWSTGTYINQSTWYGVTNAFYNNGFDFSYYMNQQGYTGVDVVGIHLGINDVTGLSNDAQVNSAITTGLANFDTMINSIKAYNSGIKIALLIPIPPSKNQDAFGKNYGANASYSRWRYKRSIFMFMKAFIDKYKGREAENIYLVPFNVNLDTEHNMSTETVQVNSRNTQTIVRQSNGVHPASPGYYQMADVIYYWIKGQQS